MLSKASCGELVDRGWGLPEGCAQLSQHGVRLPWGDAICGAWDMFIFLLQDQVRTPTRPWMSATADEL